MLEISSSINYYKYYMPSTDYFKHAVGTLIKYHKQHKQLTTWTTAYKSLTVVYIVCERESVCVHMLQSYITILIDFLCKLYIKS